MTAQRWLVNGVVQGVGFRWFVHRTATRLGVHGFVRNLANGSVEVMARGSDEALRALAAALRQGPPGAQVGRVSEEAAASEPDIPRGFEIR